MKTLKLFLIVLVILIAISLLVLWYKTFIIGMYYEASSFFMTAMGILAPVIVLYLGYKLIRLIQKSDISL